MPYGGGYSYLSSKNSRIDQYNFIKNSKRGAVLIEFAFAVPVLFSLIYYVYDLSKLKQYNERMNFVAHQVANIIQNISQSRANKQITIKDLTNIGGAAYLSILGTDYFYRASKKKDEIAWLIYYVRGEANNKASVLWDVYFESSSTENIYMFTDNSKRFEFVVKAKKNVSPSEIHPDLTIREGEVKIILECSMLSRNLALSPIEIFNFFIISPNFYKLSNAVHRYFFTSVVIFTPKPGLFSETPPE